MLADRGRRISLKDVARLAVKMGWEYVIVDGVHVPTGTFERKTGGQRAFYSGKNKRHGLNVQTVCSPAGGLLWAAAPLPGATVDITAARRAGIAAMLVSVIAVFAGPGYVGWDEQVVTGRRKPRGRELAPAQRAANRMKEAHESQGSPNQGARCHGAVSIHLPPQTRYASGRPARPRRSQLLGTPLTMVTVACGQYGGWVRLGLPRPLSSPEALAPPTRARRSGLVAPQPRRGDHANSGNIQNVRQLTIEATVNL